MTQNRIQPDMFAALLFEFPVPGDARIGASRATRLRARMFADRYDRQVEEGVPVCAGSALAVHIARLTSTRERAQLARALRTAVGDADRPRGADVGFLPRIHLCTNAIESVRDVIDELTLVLHAPRPVRARGMARLRMLLSDGGGPLYRPGRGSLNAALRGVHAAL